MQPYYISKFANLIVKREADGGESHIPNDPSNRHYKEFLDWQALGNTPDPTPIEE